MGDTNEYTVHDLVRDELYKNMDVENLQRVCHREQEISSAFGFRCCAKWRKRSRL